MAEKITARYKNKFIVLSKAEEKVGRRYDILTPHNTLVLPHAIQTINFVSRHEAQKHFGHIQTNSKIIGTVASHYKTKGLTYLIEAIEHLPAQPQWELILIGAGPETRALEQQTKHNKRVHFVQPTGNDAIFMHGFDMFVLPSVKEGYPYVLLEAMSANIPIIATRVGGVEELLANYPYAQLVEPQQPKQLAQAVTKNLTEEKTVQQSKTTQRHQIDFETYLKKIHQLYSTVLRS